MDEIQDEARLEARPLPKVVNINDITVEDTVGREGPQLEIVMDYTDDGLRIACAMVYRKGKPAFGLKTPIREEGEGE